MMFCQPVFVIPTEAEESLSSKIHFSATHRFSCGHLHMRSRRLKPSVAVIISPLRRSKCVVDHSVRNVFNKEFLIDWVPASAGMREIINS
jgi:hypothetical protein